LFETARKAKEIGADYFCTTLTVSPHKNAGLLNRIGLQAHEKYGVKYLVSDFKKKEGYKRSTELSGELGLYRQNYCGCKYSIWF
ncbi:MAG: epoxyqueuosine reductase QueH, partial [Clostridia bacterium]|nr:epoxyqueuosine reductase QueH [Clostridia bacterium]